MNPVNFSLNNNLTQTEKNEYFLELETLAWYEKIDNEERKRRKSLGLSYPRQLKKLIMYDKNTDSYLPINKDISLTEIKTHISLIRSRFKEKIPHKEIQNLIRLRKIESKLKEDFYRYQEGDRVKLNYSSIISDVNYSKKVAEYKKFCEENKGKGFIVFYPSEACKNMFFCGLKTEGGEEVIWRFNQNELILLEKQTKTKG